MVAASRRRTRAPTSGSIDTPADSVVPTETSADRSSRPVKRQRLSPSEAIEQDAANGGDTSRASASSEAATSNSISSGTDLTTPATSAIATPASTTATKSLRTRRSARNLSPEPDPRRAVSALERARRLRNSAFSLAPQLNTTDDDDIEDEDYDDENVLSLRLARQLQEEEDKAAATSMVVAVSRPRPTPRSLRARATVGGQENAVSLDDDDPSDQSFFMSDDAESSEFEAEEDSTTEQPPTNSNAASRMRRDRTKTPHRPKAARNSAALGEAHDDDVGISTPKSGSSLSPPPASDSSDTSDAGSVPSAPRRRRRRARDTSDPPEDRRAQNYMTRARKERARLTRHHPSMDTMWTQLSDLPKIETVQAPQPTTINRQLKPFQREGVHWMRKMEETKFRGGLLGDEMGMGKTIQAVSLIMSDYPAKSPSLVLVPPVALMQWQQEIGEYTDGTLKTLVLHGTNNKAKNMTVNDLCKFDVVLMSYNSLESMYRHQERGFKRKDGLSKQKSIIHQIQFHRAILDEAHNIKQRTTGVAKACFALKADYKWCLSGTPLQNRIGEFFSLVRFLDVRPFAFYFCKQCECENIDWKMDQRGRCTVCNHSGMQHVSIFNQELLNPIQRHGNSGPGKEALAKLRILTDRIMLRRVKRDHSSAMELPAKEIYVDRRFFGEEENDFAASIMHNSKRRFETYVAQGVMLNNYANIFGLIMQMRQVADHPDLILKKKSEGGQNVIVCSICDNTAEDAIRSACKHDFCRECVRAYIASQDAQGAATECPHCHIVLSIDLEQPEVEQDQELIKKTSIINRIKMENWTSSSKIEALVHDLHMMRSHNSSSKSIIFSQFTSMLQLVEWRLRRAGITTVMLDGSMTPAQRQASINHFMRNVEVECFLVSLKAGGVALNLTEASKVFIIDPWWNPAAEWQSADRCHRIGQSRPCSITRLCIEDSVESRIVLLQEKKANMINSTINKDEAAMESLTPEDMQFLFRGS